MHEGEADFPNFVVGNHGRRMKCDHGAVSQELGINGRWRDVRVAAVDPVVVVVVVVVVFVVVVVVVVAIISYHFL